jgi:FecR protein
MKKFQLKKWETGLVILAAILFLLSFIAFVTDFPLRNYIFNLTTETGGEKVGEVNSILGSLKRELMGQAEFKVIKKDDAVYQNDTIITGPEGNVTLKLDDGGVIELGPQTMVKLQIESSFNLTGISRTTHIDVVSGQVSGKSAPTGKNKVVIETATESVDLDEQEISSKKIVKASNAKPIIAAPRKTSTILAKAAPQTTAPAKFIEKVEPKKPAVVPVMTPRPTPAPVVTPSPKPSPTPLAPSPSPSPTPPQVTKWSFYLMEPQPVRPILMTKKSTVADKVVHFAWTQRSTLKTENTAFELRVGLQVWKLDAAHQHDGHALLTKIFNTHLGERVHQDWNFKDPGEDERRITEIKPEEKDVPAAKKTGKMIRSTFKVLRMILPPEPVNPPNHAQITRAAFLKWKGRILITWEMTMASQIYQLEISSTPDFKDFVLQKAMRDNFFLFKPQQNITTYWWRIVDITSGTRGQSSSTFQFSTTAVGPFPTKAATPSPSTTGSAQ